MSFHSILDPLELGNFIKSSAAFYWTMDSHKDIKNLLATDWGHPSNNSFTIKGIRDTAVYIGEGSSGVFTLSERLPKSCVFDPSLCSSGFTMMFWLWYKHKREGAKQLFFSSGGDNHRGHKMYQVVSKTPQVWSL